MIHIRVFVADPATAPVPTGTLALAAFPSVDGVPLTSGGPLAFLYLPAIQVDPTGTKTFPVEFDVTPDAGVSLDQGWLTAQVTAQLAK